MQNTNAGQIRIIVDTREKAKIRRLLHKAGIIYELEALQTGDYKAVTNHGTVTIERKSVSDFLSSVMSGRLDDQMYRMAQEDFPILLLTGSYDEVKRFFKTGRVNDTTIHENIASFIVQYGLRCVIWIQAIDGNPHEDGLILAGKLLTHLGKGELDKIPDRKVRHQDHPQRELLKHILNVPSDVATNLLKEFGSVRGVLNSSDEALKRVRGVGPLRIKRMRMMLDGL